MQLEHQPLQDETTIRNLYQKLLDSWTRGDGQAYAAHFTEDADYIIASGKLEKGRAAIAAGHQQIFDTWAKDTRLTGQIQSMRFLSADITLLIATGAILMPGQEAANPDEGTIYSMIAVKGDGNWLFTAYQNTPFQS